MYTLTIPSIGVVNEIMATVSLERTFFRVDETDNSVEVCVLFRGLGVGENTVTITIFTQDGSAVGMSQFMAPCAMHMSHEAWRTCWTVLTLLV